MIILSIVEQASVYIPLVLGAYLSYSLMRVPNLAIESAYMFGAVMAYSFAQLDLWGPHVLLLVLIGSVFGGALVGLVVSYLSEKQKFSYILSAIIATGLFHGLGQIVLGGSHGNLSGYYNPLGMVEYRPEYPDLIMSLIVSGCSVLALSLFLRTQLGMSCVIFGDNKNFLKNYRMNQAYIGMTGLAVSNALAGISGYMVAQNNGFVDLTMGLGISLLCLSALILGKVFCFSLFSVRVYVPVVGIFLYFMLQTGMLKLGFDLRYFLAMQAFIIALLLMLFTKLFVRVSIKDLLGI